MLASEQDDIGSPLPGEEQQGEREAGIGADWVPTI
jgi:hypothetical protein